MQTRINLEPMPGKVIVRPDSTDKMVGGIWLVRNDRQSLGQVVAVYSDFTDPDTDAEMEAFVRLDDWVIFGKHSGVEVTIGREKYIILREMELLCRVADPDALEDKSKVEAV